MRRVETLAKALARFDDELDKLKDVTTFSALINKTSNFDFISDTINKAAEERGMYVGEISWASVDKDTAKLIVGVGKDEKAYNKKYLVGGKYDPSDFRWS